ncbi:MAG: PEP-CTERM sorting domain-containing protein [Crocosphaera sp.]
MKHSVTLLLVVGASVSIGLPAHAADFDLFIEPPEELSLNGQQINFGTFNVTEARGYYNDDGSLVTTTLVEEIITHEATIGSTERHNLFTVPMSVQALNIVGFFDATDPDLDPAQFNIWVNGFDGEFSEFTYFLPSNVNSFAYQVTDLGSTTYLADNTDIFSASAPSIDITSDGSLSIVNISAPPSQFIPYPHGTSRPVPEPLTILGAGAAISFGSAFKRKLAHTKENKRFKENT